MILDFGKKIDVLRERLLMSKDRTKHQSFVQR